jgi:2,3-bisphosphoglycerate-independent phosphoglycerate mutase
VASSPTEALDEPIEGHLPGGAPGTASLSLRRLITIACDTLGAHPINVARKEQGLSQASRLWIWDAGKPARSRTITDRFGIKGPGALIATDPAMIGAGVAVGLRNLNLAQGIPNNFMEDSVLGEAAVDALASHDLVVCHARSPALCALGGNWEAKIASLEAIDRFIVGPIASRLPDFGDPTQDPDARGWRLLVTPGRLVSCASRRAEDDPVPFLIAGAWIRSVVPRPFTEIAAESSDLVIERGTDLMEFFLLGGLARTRAIGKPRIEPRSGLLWGPGTDT